ncbi:YeeE/YedE family protein [Roseicyclus persicicus]|uniref:YeeE/YedE family protein n=1 Tax=Roseicyclus persicicus TaxID=2650661 RepID=A0A7X6H0H0_9RHOB|nr:YeeE/YedE family protein [Roseibacterium persicicum]NKX45751.1 YeeE/YedE family protein [Roseibacterium persicicum]
MLDFLGEAWTITLIGLGGGLVLGLAARLGRFCTLGMIEDVHYGHDRSRLWMWAVALGTAMAVAFGAEAAGLIRLHDAIYLHNGFTLAGAAVGGLMFGYGMAQAGNCGYGMLARLGGGDLRAMVIALVMGVAAYVTLSGPLAALRARLFPFEPHPEAPQGWAHMLGDATGLPAWAIGGALGVALILGAGAALVRARRWKELVWATAAGGAIASGFLGTSWVANTGFEPWLVQSHTFTAPVGDSIRYAMFSSGLEPDFAIGSVLGVLIGAFAGSLIRDGFRWEACDDPRELKRQMGGAVLMGFGAVIAAGCSVGQGLSALSLLSFHAPVVAGAIWIGAWVGLRQLILGLGLARTA